MNDRAKPVPAGSAAQGGIPLNLAPLLTPYGQHQRLTIRVVYLPPRAELTRGVRNEDASWSLTPAELEGLELLLPDDSEPPPTVGVRIVGIDRNENASIVGQFEVPLPRSTRVKGSSAAEAAMVATLQNRLDRRAAAAKRLADRKVARALAEAEAKWRAAGDTGANKEAKRQQKEWQEKLAAEAKGRKAAEARAEDSAQQAAALQAERDEALSRAAAAEAAAASSEAAADAQPSAEEIEQRIAELVEARLATARKKWEAQAANGRSANLEQAVAKAVEEARAQSESEAAARLEAARSAWEKEAAAELEAARAAWPQEASEALETAKAELAEAQAGAQEVAQEIEGLRKQLAATDTLRRDLEVTRKELTAAEAAAKDLQSLRKGLEKALAAKTELEAKLEETKAQAESDVEAQLANREQVLELEWREKLLGERNARQAAETKAAEAAQQLAPLTAEAEALRVRLTAAEAKAANREEDLQRQAREAEARFARELETQIAAARSEWQAEQEKHDEARLARELEKRIASSEAGWESNRQRDGEDRIAAAVDQAVKKAENKAQTRLEQARADWEKELRSALAIAEGKWQAEAAKRLAAAQKEWNRNSELELARGRSKLRGAARRQWRLPAWRLVKRAAFAAACATAVFLLVTQFKPLIREYADPARWKPKVMEMVEGAKSTALDQYDSLTGKPASHRTVAAELANVRSGPSTDSDVVARLPRDTEVTVLERRGAWIRVPVESASAGDGWLHETLLDSAAR